MCIEGKAGVRSERRGEEGLRRVSFVCRRGAVIGRGRGLIHAAGCWGGGAVGVVDKGLIWGAIVCV